MTELTAPCINLQESRLSRAGGAAPSLFWTRHWIKRDDEPLVTGVRKNPHVCMMRIKKAPRKAHVPGGQRTLRLFRERLDPITLSLADMRASVSLTRMTGGVSRRWKASVPTSRFGIDRLKLSRSSTWVRLFWLPSLLGASARHELLNEVLEMLASFCWLPCLVERQMRCSLVVRRRIRRPRNTVKADLEHHEKLFGIDIVVHQCDR